MLAVLKADKIFQELEKEKKLKASKEKREIQDAHVQQMVTVPIFTEILKVNM